MKKKKLTDQATYCKGTSFTKDALLDIVEESTDIFITEEKKYDDNSFSILVEIHFFDTITTQKS